MAINVIWLQGTAYGWTDGRTDGCLGTDTVPVTVSSEQRSTSTELNENVARQLDIVLG